MKRLISVMLIATMIFSIVSCNVFAAQTNAKTTVMLLEDDFEDYSDYEEAEEGGWTCSGILTKGQIGTGKTKYLQVRTGTMNKVYKPLSKQIALRSGSGLSDSDKTIANPGINAKLIAEFDFNSMEFAEETVTNFAWYGLTSEDFTIAAAVSTKPEVIGGGYVFSGNTVDISNTKIIVPKTENFKVWQSVKFEITITDEAGNFFSDGPKVTIYQKNASEAEWTDRTAQWPETESRGLLNKVKILDRFVVTSNASSRYQGIDNVVIYLENEGEAIAGEQKDTSTPAPEKAWMGAVTTAAPCPDIVMTEAVGNITKEEAAKNTKGLYMTPDGAGTKDGSSWENAFCGKEEGVLQKAVDELADDGTLYVLGGTYNNLAAVLSAGGKSVSEPRKIVGVNDGQKRAEFIGDFNPLEASSSKIILFEISAQVKNIHIENIVIKNYHMGVHTAGENEGLRFYNMSLSHFGDGFYLDGGSSATGVRNNKDIIIDGCDGYFYKKRFIRFRNGNNGAIVSNCRADAGGKDAWEAANWPVGVGIENNDFGAWEENITVVDSVFENSYQEPEDVTKYWNGDGVSAERTTRNLTFIRVSCFNATDAGWDLKTINPVLIDCVAMGNKRGFRFWSAECATLVNCLGAYSKAVGGGSSVGLWTNAYVEAYNSTFFNNEDSQVEVAEGTGRMALINCIVGYYGIKSELYSIGGGINGVEPQIKVNVAEYPGVDPKFVNMTDKKFYGNNDSWNSTIHNGATGYHYNPQRKTKANAVTSDYGKIVDVYEAYSWAAEAVDFMCQNGYMSPWSHTTFGTQYNVSRGEFGAMLVKTLGLKGSKTPTFTDVDITNEFYNEIGIAQEIGLIKGEEAGDGAFIFRPYDNMTREEMMVMLSRALKLAGKLDNGYSADLAALDAFSDKDIIADWAKQEVANMVDKKIIQGADGAINPKGNTTRAEAAVIGQRIYNLK